MTKATKHDNGKPDLSQVSYELVSEVAKVRMFGEKKYARDNWKQGFKVTRSCAAALRHIFQFLSGETYDSESGHLHLAHAVCSLEHAIYDMIHHPENDDRYKETQDEPNSNHKSEAVTYTGPQSSYDRISNMRGRE